ncbi:hypothetical protein [Colwellia echini]|uniref:Uncharacterized protein n=1 Tax=Colwellia echini TaxID=1982103 RepID=A0ABY3N1M8_9GAMM|nr:hypothetical protein [Colwellia echini]TYK67401.1 hypothetical protein CWS31_002430 [Colwellia echini]
MSIQLGSSGSYTKAPNMQVIMPVVHKSKSLKSGTQKRAQAFSDLLTVEQINKARRNIVGKVATDANFDLMNTQSFKEENRLQQKFIDIYMRSSAVNSSKVNTIELDDRGISAVTVKQLNTYNSLMMPRASSYIHLSA